MLMKSCSANSKWCIPSMKARSIGKPPNSASTSWEAKYASLVVTRMLVSRVSRFVISGSGSIPIARVAVPSLRQVDPGGVVVRLSVFGLGTQRAGKRLRGGGELTRLIRVHAGFEGDLPGPQAALGREQIFEYPSQHAALSLTQSGR